MKRFIETFSFGSQRHRSKSRRYTGRRRRGPHRYTAIARAIAASVAGTCMQACRLLQKGAAVTYLSVHGLQFYPV